MRAATPSSGRIQRGSDLPGGSGVGQSGADLLVGGVLVVQVHPRPLPVRSSGRRQSARPRVSRMTAVDSDQSDRLEQMRQQWFGGSPAGDWETEFLRLKEEWSAVEWQSGGSTLLTALGLKFNEVALCQGLAWLLDPSAGHGLGRMPVNAFLHNLGLQAMSDGSVDIRVEETRGDTRADIVLRVGEQTVLIEAKVLAGEQWKQADRLAKHWADEQPTLVFLSRAGHAPYTAVDSGEQWVTRSWREVAALLRAVTDQEGVEASGGARDFIQTIGEL